MKQDNVIQTKTFQFSLKMISLYKILTENKEYILSKQLLRSGTSIGANVEEAIAAQSKKDFVAKMAISSKEARETKY
jgi:four helix bundle protein